MKKQSTSWETVSRWYDKAVGESGHYYHERIILPKIEKILDLSHTSTLLDLACGQGILSRHIPASCRYVGVDIAKTLIQLAQKKNKNPLHAFHVSDITQPLKIPSQEFSHCTCILAIQNIEHPKNVFVNAYQALAPQGTFLLVMNHPYFRIPRQSSWGVDLEKKIQYRRLDGYLSAMRIPIQTHPSQGSQSSQTLSFHYPLSQYTKWLHESGFLISEIEEWCSDKTSTGKYAKMENRSRQEFPLFMAITGKKL